MIRFSLKRMAACLAVALMWNAPCALAQQPYSFYVLQQRTIALTAQYWHPILSHVSGKSGVPLKLTLPYGKGRMAAMEFPDHDFVFTNHLFTPSRERLGYRVIVRPSGPGIRAQIVVPMGSPIKVLRDLDGKEVALGRSEAFTGYWLPMDALLRAGVTVNAVPTDNTTAAYALLRDGKVLAAGIDAGVMARIGRSAPFDYRAIWTSEPYPDLCVMAHPRVPRDKVAAVKAAFIGMAADPEGRQVLEACAELLRIEEGLSFVAAEDGDYEGYRAFFRTTRVK